MKKDQERLEKQLAETQSENRRLQDPLQKAREELAELHKQLSSYERDKTSLRVSRCIYYVGILNGYSITCHSLSVRPYCTILLDIRGEYTTLTICRMQKHG